MIVVWLLIILLGLHGRVGAWLEIGGHWSRSSYYQRTEDKRHGRTSKGMGGFRGPWPPTSKLRIVSVVQHLYNPGKKKSFVQAPFYSHLIFSLT